MVGARGFEPPTPCAQGGFQTLLKSTENRRPQLIGVAWARALLVRRSIEEKPECAYYLCYAPTGKDTLATLVRVAGQRWLIEQCFETAKGECGLDHYEVRHWQGWYRHITLSMLAHAVLSVLRARGEKNSRRTSAAQRTRIAPPAHVDAVARMARH